MSLARGRRHHLRYAYESDHALPNTPAVLSLGRLVRENGYKYVWEDEHPRLIKDDYEVICYPQHDVPFITPANTTDPDTPHQDVDSQSQEYHDYVRFRELSQPMIISPTNSPRSHGQPDGTPAPTPITADVPKSMSEHKTPPFPHDSKDLKFFPSPTEASNPNLTSEFSRTHEHLPSSSSSNAGPGQARPGQGHETPQIPYWCPKEGQGDSRGIQGAQRSVAAMP